MECVMLEKPLEDGAKAVVIESQIMLNGFARRIERARDLLELCKVPYDAQQMRRLLDDLEAMYANMCHITIAHLDAIDSQVAH